MLNGLRVTQLQAVLQYFEPNRISGRKQELVTRIGNLLRDKKHQHLTCQRIREVTRSAAVPSSYAPVRTPFNQYHRGIAGYPQPLRGVAPGYSQAFMPNQLGGNMAANVPVIMPSRAGGRAEKMSITRLPFYDVMEVSCNTFFATIYSFYF